MRIVGDFYINGSCRNIFKTLNVLKILLLYVLGTCLLKKVNVAKCWMVEEILENVEFIYFIPNIHVLNHSFYSVVELFILDFHIYTSFNKTV